jgi:hypothetical protein
VHASHPSSQAWLWPKNLLSGVATQKHRRSKDCCYRLPPERKQLRSMGNLLSLGRLVGLVAKIRHDRKSPGLPGL